MTVLMHVAAGATTGNADGEEPADEAPEPVAAPQAPQAPVAPRASASVTPAGPGQRRIARHTTTTTTRTESQTTTDETVVETVAVAPPVYAAPAGEHPRPVG